MGILHLQWLFLPLEAPIHRLRQIGGQFFRLQLAFQFNELVFLLFIRLSCIDVILRSRTLLDGIALTFELRRQRTLVVGICGCEFVAEGGFEGLHALVQLSLGFVELGDAFSECRMFRTHTRSFQSINRGLFLQVLLAYRANFVIRHVDTRCVSRKLIA